MIKQPNNIKNGRLELDFNYNFANARQDQIDQAQKIVDSEVLRHCSKLVPFDKGVLDKSGQLNTVIGSGEVIYSTPYAARLYYNPQYKFQGAPTRGAYWFERMKPLHKDDILKKASEALD